MNSIIKQLLENANDCLSKVNVNEIDTLSNEEIQLLRQLKMRIRDLRNGLIIKLHLSGTQNVQIAASLGMSPARVCQIIVSYNRHRELGIKYESSSVLLVDRPPPTANIGDQYY